MLKLLPQGKVNNLVVAHRNELLILRDEIQSLKTEIYAMKYGSTEEKNRNKNSKRISFFSHGCHRMVTPENILYCEAEGNYSRVFLVKNESLFISKTLKEIEAALPSETFARCHHSFVINLSQVRSYSMLGGSLSLEVLSGLSVPVSRRNKNKILSRL